MSNWVEQRARQEDLLSLWRPKVWENLLLHLESAANSYTNHFGPRDQASATYTCGDGVANVSWNPTDPNLPHKSLRQHATLRVVRVDGWSFIEASYYGYGTPSKSVKLEFVLTGEGEDQVGLACEGKSISSELAARLLLEPLLFPYSPPVVMR
jgi:hypothetical protein